MSNRVSEKLFAECKYDYLGRLIGYELVERQKLKYRTKKNPDPYGYTKPTAPRPKKQVIQPTRQVEPMKSLPIGSSSIMSTSSEATDLLPIGFLNIACIDQMGIPYE